MPFTGGVLYQKTPQRLFRAERITSAECRPAEGEGTVRVPFAVRIIGQDLFVFPDRLGILLLHRERVADQYQSIVDQVTVRMVTHQESGVFNRSYVEPFCLFRYLGDTLFKRIFSEFFSFVECSFGIVECIVVRTAKREGAG